MPRWTEKFWDGRWWTRDEWDAMREAQRARSASGPAVISDGMSDTWNPADGRTYDSKSSYYRAVRNAGCEIVGNDTSVLGRRPTFDPGPVGPDLKRAIQQLGGL